MTSDASGVHRPRQVVDIGPMCHAHCFLWSGQGLSVRCKNAWVDVKGQRSPCLLPSTTCHHAALVRFATQPVMATTCSCSKPCPRPGPLTPRGAFLTMQVDPPGTQGRSMFPPPPRPLEIIALAPHPDDLEITCGGTLALLVKQGYRVSMIDLTSGEPPARAHRSGECRGGAAREILGVRCASTWTAQPGADGLPREPLRGGHAFRRSVPGWSGHRRPDAPPASPDPPPGAPAVEAARFYSQLTKWDDASRTRRLTRTRTWSTLPFHRRRVRHWHSTFVVTSPTLRQKMRAIQCYESQFEPSASSAEARRQRLQRHARQPLRLRLRRVVRPAPADRGGGPDDLVCGAKGASAAPVPLPGQPPAAAALNARGTRRISDGPTIITICRRRCPTRWVMKRSRPALLCPGPAARLGGGGAGAAR